MKGKIIIAVLMVLIMSCVSMETKSEIGLKDKSVEEILNTYNLNVLSKIDQKKIPKYIVAIIGDSTQIADADIDLGLLLESELNKSGRVQIVDRNNMDKIFQEQNLVFQGLTEEGSIEIGELAGAEFLLVSNVVASSKQKKDEIIYEIMEVSVTIQVKLVNVSTGEVYLSVDETGDVTEKLVVDADGNLVSGAIDYNNLYKEATINAINSVSKELLEKFPAIGFVLNVDEGHIKTDLGTKSGIKPGSRIAIINRVGPIYHPITEQLTSYDYDYAANGVVSMAGATSSKIEIKEEFGNIDNASIIVLID